MKKRCIGYIACLLMVLCLYFFENNTGTRAVLLFAGLLPLLPSARRALFSPDDLSNAKRPAEREKRIRTAGKADGEGDVRAYLPGDPVNRIHWKLSAKRDEWLVRQEEWEEAAEEKNKKYPLPASVKGRETFPLCILLIGLSAALFFLSLLFLVPVASLSFKALANRIFESSERVNAYVYHRFPAPEGQSVYLAGILIGCVILSLLAVTALIKSRVMALLLAAGCVLFQVYFGLSFPLWAHVLLSALFILAVCRRPWKKRDMLTLLLCMGAAVLFVSWISPGVDAPTEEASERVRDTFSQIAQRLTDTAKEDTGGEMEARHIHPESLLSGSQEGRTQKEFRLVIVEEEQVSMPHWVNYIKIILLLLLSVALVVLPFLPFLFLNARRKKALEMRRAFADEDVSAAVCAIFQQAVAWLEGMGLGGGNAPYTAWAEALSQEITPAYADQFFSCAKLFEEAAYSRHVLQEEQRNQALALLHETEAVLRPRADWKTKMRLQYKECLWI